jgi:hypothetical protein
MISKIHQKLGTAGFIISIVALVAALGGGAYAASGGLTGKQKKEVEKIAKKYAGKPGAVGATGPSGPAGAKGDAGAAGATGTNGTNGTNGNQGSPWTAGGVLPAGSTESGVWGFGGTSTSSTTSGELGQSTLIVAPISFVVPFSKEEAPLARYVKTGETGVEGCPGTVESPEAEPGFLCVYEEGGTFGGATLEVNSHPGGAIVIGSSSELEVTYGFGTWAVTGE